MKKIFKNSINRLDIICWAFVVAFFCGCALMFNGNLNQSLMAAVGIVLAMILIGLSIEVIIDALRDVKGIGTITGFITNGPELVCLVVGLIAGDLLFAASTPLGSNLINPILLILAALINRVFLKTFKTNWEYSLICIPSTIGLAVSFYAIQSQNHLYWLVTASLLTVFLFIKRPEEEIENVEDDETERLKSLWPIIPAICVLITTGYFLDPIVTYASEKSQAPKGVIGFFILASLSSWPEFKTCLVFMSRRKYQSAILNITVSNITNIWLAILGVSTYLTIGTP